MLLFNQQEKKVADMIQADMPNEGGVYFVPSYVKCGSGYRNESPVRARCVGSNVFLGDCL